MSQERLYTVLLAPHISEKATLVADENNQVVFRVIPDASKQEVKAAVELLFNVKVKDVRVLNNKGKTKRTRFGMGKRSDWKKAYVRLEQGQELDFAIAE